MGDDGRPGQLHEELRHRRRLGACRRKATVDVPLQLGGQTETTVALRELDPGQTGVELVAAELLVALGIGVVVGE